MPAKLRWLVMPLEAQADDGRLSIAAGERSDWFIDPGSGEVMSNAPALVGPSMGDFVLSARVEVDFAATFDAGALFVWRDERTWAKLAFELSPQGRPMVVSVVTRGESDDCNSMDVGTGAIWLRAARRGAAFAFHASFDAKSWLFVRHFRLGTSGDPEVGFEAQSPRGEGCRAHFTQMALAAATLGDLRSGE